MTSQTLTVLITYRTLSAVIVLFNNVKETLMASVRLNAFVQICPEYIQADDLKNKIIRLRIVIGKVIERNSAGVCKVELRPWIQIPGFSYSMHKPTQQYIDIHEMHLEMLGGAKPSPKAQPLE
jgi:hypothetical protein